MIATLIKRLTDTVFLCLLGFMATAWQSPVAQTFPGSLPDSLPGTEPGPGGGLFSRSGFLPVDEAFSFYTAVPAAGVIVLHWSIAPEYYLYRDKFAVTLDYTADDSPGSTEVSHTVTLELPAGVAHHDEYFGDVEVFYDTLEFQVPIPQTTHNEAFTMTIRYQGCAERGLCYPEQLREIAMEPQALIEL